MAQLSRPYQIGLAAIVLLAAVWLVLLQGHSSSPSSPASSAAVAPASTAPATIAATNAGSKASSSSSAAKHASKAGAAPSAPGMAGLTRAIEKAHGAAAVSQQTNAHLQERSAQASSPSTTTTTGAATNAAPAKAVTSTPTTTAAPSTPAAAPTSTKVAPAHKIASRVNSPTKERTVEAQLAHGKIALILFWNPKGADDQEVHRALGKLSSKGIAVNESFASDIASFGTITRGIQVYGTPTLLIVNKKGQTIVLTGSQDAFAVEQAISEARHS